MPRPTTDRVEPRTLAANEARIERRYPLKSLPRLAEMLAGDAGEVVARIRFFQVETNLPGGEIELSAVVPLRCQRCLEPYGEPVSARTRVVFVENDERSGAVPDQYEAVTAPEGVIDLQELVEDELLLSLPIVARHPEDSACARSGAYEGEPRDDEQDKPDTQRPFEALRDLIKN